MIHFQNGHVIMCIYNQPVDDTDYWLRNMYVQIRLAE